MKTFSFIVASLALLTFRSYAQDQNKTVSKFDFIPGEKIVFFDDFSSGNVGDFPASWNTSSSGEIVTIAKYPGRWFQLTKGGFFIPEAKEIFTDNFTVEFDFVPMVTGSSENMYGIDFFIVSGSLDKPNEGGAIPGKAGTITRKKMKVIKTTARVFFSLRPGKNTMLLSGYKNNA